MSDTVISVENLSKCYQLGVIGTGTFRGDVQRWWARQRGKPDPYLTIGENDQSSREGETIWALKDITFSVQQGEALGIIGRNGAGKSTLLKILSQVTAPTSGLVKVKGRIASLLEVGTGFHPELTGRENIYLNGAILGMTRSEVTRKFDEIVEFSGVEKFIGTPVKRYSSGMYVRLAFAVAAHLDPEILVVDEVLAVGDAEFQKKCLGMMGDVAHEGRTVLFVSHNLGAIITLCNRAILIDQGNILLNSDTNSVVQKYLQNSIIDTESTIFIRKDFDENSHLIKSVELFNSEKKAQRDFVFGDQLILIIKTNKLINKEFNLQIRIKNSKKEILGFASSLFHPVKNFSSGQIIKVTFPKLPFVQDDYYLDFICNIPNIEHIDNFWDCVNFSIINCKPGNYPLSVGVSNYLGSVVFESVLMGVH
jgi:lipopolysaccharide transport system ATP-binding protein